MKTLKEKSGEGVEKWCDLFWLVFSSIVSSFICLSKLSRVFVFIHIFFSSMINKRQSAKKANQIYFLFDGWPRSIGKGQEMSDREYSYSLSVQWTIARRFQVSKLMCFFFFSLSFNHTWSWFIFFSSFVSTSFVWQRMIKRRSLTMHGERCWTCSDDTESDGLVTRSTNLPTNLSLFLFVFELGHRFKMNLQLHFYLFRCSNDVNW